MPMRQHTSTTRGRSTKICTTLRSPSYWEECNERPTWTAHLVTDFILIIQPIIAILSFAQQIILIVASWLFSRGENRLDPDLWENSGATRVSVRRVKVKEQTEDSSNPKGIEVMLRETTRKSFPENVDNPMIAPRDYKVRQSGRVLELRAKISGSDLQIYPGTSLFLWRSVICVSEINVEGQLRIWKPGMKLRS